jgi:hypothetical protein
VKFRQAFAILLVILNSHVAANADETNPSPSPSITNSAENLLIPKSQLTSLETKDGGILCYATDFTPESVVKYSITGTHWRIAMKYKNAITVLDEYDWPIGLSSNNTTSREDTFNGVKITNKVNDQYIIYGYGVRNQLKDAVYQCAVAIISKNGNGPYSFAYSTATFNTTDFKPSAESVTITCKKGKITKKVNGTKPVCPKGFKKTN